MLAPEIDSIRCLRAIRTADPGFSIELIEPLGPGWDHAVFLVNETWVFRFPLRSSVADAFAREVSLLPLIGERGAATIPKYEFLAPPNDFWPFPFGGYVRLPGWPLDSTSVAFSPDIIQEIAQQVGTFLAHLHRLPFDSAIEAGISPFRYVQWSDDRARLADQAFDSVASEFSRPEAMLIRDHFSVLFDRIDWPAIAPAMIHGDLSSEHILVDLEGAVRVSIIDFGDLQIGDPALDFAGIPDHLLWPSVAAYGLSLGKDFTLRRSLYQDLVPAYAVQAGIELDRQDLIQEGVDGLRRLTERVRWLKN